MVKSIGIKEIASLAEVSIGTIDRVIHKRTGVSLEKKKKVLDIIKKTGYKKNNIASRLKLSKNKTIYIAVIFPHESNESGHYWNQHLIGIKKGIRELKNLGITYSLHTFIMSKRDTFKLISEKILKTNIQGIITVPFFKDECEKLSSIAFAENIPIVYLDTKYQSKQPHYYILQNSFKGGMVAAKILNHSIGISGNYIIVNILNRVQTNQIDREDGFRSFFKINFDKIKINIKSITCLSDNLNPLEDLINEVALVNKPFGIFVTNSHSYLIPEIITRLEITNPCIIIGFDLNPMNAELLKSNKIHFILNQKPEYQSYLAVKGLFKKISQEVDEDIKIEIPVEILVKENI